MFQISIGKFLFAYIKVNFLGVVTLIIIDICTCVSMRMLNDVVGNPPFFRKNNNKVQENYLCLILTQQCNTKKVISNNALHTL